MPRYYYSGARSTIEEVKRIEMPALKKLGYLSNKNQHIQGRIDWNFNGNPSGNIWIDINTEEDISPYIRLEYGIKQNGEPEENRRQYDYKFQLEKLPCYFGGFRWFFHCGLTKNGVYCGRRVRVLYNVGDYFGCRHCTSLSYQSCNESRYHRSGYFRVFSTMNKADRYREKLKRYYYRGVPTKKYERYLKMTKGLDEVKILEAEIEMLRGLNNCFSKV